MAVESVLVLAGPETGKRDRHIEQLKARCAREWGEPPEEHRLHAPETGVDQLLDLLRNGSLFAAGKLVLVFDAEAYKGKALCAPLAAYMKNPAERTSLVLITEGYGLEKSLEDAAGKDRRIVFWELREDEKERLIRDWFRKAGLGADEEAVAAILSLVENNSAALEAECARLANFLDGAETVDAETVEAYISRTRGVDAFAVFDAMARGELGAALETLDAVLSGREGNGVGILAGLQWSMRRVAQVHAVMAGGASFEDASRSVRATSRKQLATLDAARRRWSAPVCADLVAFGTDLDLALRSAGTTFERHLLSLYLYACVAKRGPVPLRQRADSFLDPA